MVEVWAAVAEASVTVAGLGVSGLNRQSQQGRDSLVRLTTAWWTICPALRSCTMTSDPKMLRYSPD